jgi:hypothetical protein
MMQVCPICDGHADRIPTNSRITAINCPRCGYFEITHEALFALDGGIIREEPLRWAITSHALRRTGSTNQRPFTIRQNWLTTIWESNRLPNPQQQANYFIDYLGQSAHAPDQWIACEPIKIAGIIGTADPASPRTTSGFSYVVDNLLQQGLIERPSNIGEIKYGLTFLGWAQFEELRKVRIESNVAFMAMGYGNPIVGEAFVQFRTAITQIGVDLRRLDTKPQSGLGVGVDPVWWTVCRLGPLGFLEYLHLVGDWR